MISLQGITKSFNRPGEPPLTVLKGVDTVIEAGEYVAVVGASGSGKSTLMNIIGLLDRPDSGEYRLADQAVSELGAKQLAAIRNRKIGFVFQQFHLLPRTTAMENVLLPLIYSDADIADPEEKAVAALCQVGLGDRLRHYPSQLSGGQQQRVAIARALVNDPEVILADEPTGNLDRVTGAEIIALLEQLHQRGRSIVVVTHDEAVAAQAGRILRIDDGRLHSEPARTGQVQASTARGQV